MKNLYMLLMLCMGIVPVFSQTLFTYGGHTVSKDEFLKAYNKNKTPETNKEASLREYLELYSRFKLKVKTAELQRLDTLQQLRYDLQNFRSQVAESYMNDKEGLNALVEEALLRAQKDIHLLRFYIPIADTMSPADTLRVYSAMNELYTQLAADTSFDPAQQVTDKNSLVKKTDLGYITVFSLPYEIENSVYALKKVEITRPIRTRSGLQVFKHAGERRSAGKWKVAQILISTAPGATSAELEAARKKADSIYTLLMNGVGFSTVAKQFSEDRLTYLNGGELTEFGTGKFEQPFETNVFDLKKDGEISRPFLSSYGYHIVKRLQQKDTPADLTDEEFTNYLRQAVLHDSRVNGSKANFEKDIKIKTGFKRNVAVRDTELFRYADSVSLNQVIKNYPINNKTIFSFAKSAIKGADWLNFVKDYKLNPDVYKGESNSVLLNKFISTASFDYYRKHLEEYNLDFKKQMQEFREGNMLFEIMERNVWNKASGDSAGLVKYYNDHRSRYFWAASAAVILFNGADSTITQEAVTALRNGKDWKLISSESEGQVSADSGRYELTQLSLPAGIVVKEGMIISQADNSGDNASGFLKVLKLFPANEPRSFEEARGLVINDYQGFLDEQWIAELKKKYPVVLNETVFQSLLAD